eukprot:g72217.t1
MANNVILNYAVASCLYFCLPGTAACAQVWNKLPVRSAMANNVILNYAVASCLYFCLPSTAASSCCLFALARPVCGLEWHLILGLGVEQTPGEVWNKLPVRSAMANNVILNYAVASCLYFCLPGTAACAQIRCGTNSQLWQRAKLLVDSKKVDMENIPNLFNECQEQVMLLMLDDPFPRFVRSAL